MEKKRQKRKLETNGVISPFTNKRFLAKEEVTKQLKLERQARLNAEQRERYWREKFEAGCTEMENDDHADLSKMFEGVADNVPDSMGSLWEQQENLLRCKTKNAYRWHPKIYKNKVKETPGWNEEILMWCRNAAQENGLKPGDYMGGFAIDEMKVQENLEMTSVSGKHKLVGFVDLGRGHDLARTLSGEDSQTELATHVLQFFFPE